MYTRCPQCVTIFEIDEEALQASLGIVRCGHCGERFDALRMLSDTLPPEPDAGLDARDSAERLPTLTEVVPPSAFETSASKRRHDSAAAPVAPVQESGPGDPAPPPETTPPDLDLPLPGGSSDWFAEIETELTSSLIADATATAGDNLWQVSGLNVATRFVDADVVVTFAEFPARAASGVVAPPDPASRPEIPFEEIAASAVDAVTEPAFEVTTPYVPDIVDTDLQLPEAWTLEQLAADDDESAPHLPSTVISDPARRLAPVYVRPRRRRTTGVAWVLGCLALALVLAGQLVWSQRVQLVKDPATRAWAMRVCKRVACRLPPIRDTAKLELVSRDVRPDPHSAGALMITATVRNDAPFPQPWPVVVVELTDIDNNAVAMRRFRPAEYMPDPALRAAGIAPGATSAIAFEVADPGKRAVAFQFGFQ